MGVAEAEKPRRNLGSAGLADRATMAGGAVNRRGVDCGPGAHPPRGCQTYRRIRVSEGAWNGGSGSRKAEMKSRLSRPGGPRHYGGRRGESTRHRLRAGGPPSHGLLDVQANSGFGGRGEWGLRKPKSRDEISAQQAWRPGPLWRAGG